MMFANAYEAHLFGRALAIELATAESSPVPRGESVASGVASTSGLPIPSPGATNHLGHRHMPDASPRTRALAAVAADSSAAVAEPSNAGPLCRRCEKRPAAGWRQLCGPCEDHYRELAWDYEDEDEDRWGWDR